MMNHPEFPIVSFLMIPLLLCSLPSHIRAGSISLISLCLWLLAANLIHGVNSLVWAGNVDIKLVVWCDITMEILVAFTAGVPLSVLCVSRHLESISSNRHALFTHADKRRRMKIEFVLCFIVPLPFAALHYVFQGHRFDIIEDMGCNPATFITIPTLLFYSLPPVLISLTSMCYSRKSDQFVSALVYDVMMIVAAVHHFLKRRIEFTSMLRSSRSAMTPGRYLRLLLFAFSDIFLHGAATSLIFYFNAEAGIHPYVSWDYVHLDFSRIGLFPRILIPLTTYRELLFAWWVSPAGSVIFFLLFSFGREAVTDYIAAWNWIKKCVLFLIPKTRHGLPFYTSESTTSQQVVLPRTSALTIVNPKPWDEESLKDDDVPDSSVPGSARETLDEHTIIIPDHTIPLPVHLPHQLPHTGFLDPPEDSTPTMLSHTHTIAARFATQLPTRPRPFSVYTL